MPIRRDSSTTTTGGSSSSEDGQDFLDSLTRKQVLEINDAFEKGARGEEAGAGYVTSNSNTSNQPANKRRRLEKGKGKAKSEAEPEQAPGGFFVGGASSDDDDEEAQGGFMKDTEPSAAGGFLLEDEDDGDAATGSGGGGGFLPASPSASRSQKSGSSSKPSLARGASKSILLDRIPSVLESLGLDGDDGSILSIFENASFEDQSQGGLQAVKRKDFLKVAAILITQRDNDREQERQYIRKEKKSTNEDSNRKGKGKAGTFVASGGGKGRAVNIDADELHGGNEHDDSDPLILSTSDEDEEDDDPYNRDNEDSDPWADEDEIDGAFSGGRGSSPPSKRRTTRSRAKDTSPLSDLPSEYEDETSTKGKKGGKAKGKGRQQGDGSGKYQLSSRQKEECNKMFQQFFPSNDTNRNRAISMAEIRYVATLLNEKLSDEDVIEMLEYASNTRDRSVNLDAFSKIMVDVKAV